jgi:hypothetical protein
VEVDTDDEGEGSGWALSGGPGASGEPRPGPLPGCRPEAGHRGGGGAGDALGEILSYAAAAPVLSLEEDRAILLRIMQVSGCPSGLCGSLWLVFVRGGVVVIVVVLGGREGGGGRDLPSTPVHLIC